VKEGEDDHRFKNFWSTLIIRTSLFPIVLLEMMISQYIIPNKSFQYIEAETFSLYISLLLLSIFSAAPFYTYLISSK